MKPIELINRFIEKRKERKRDKEQHVFIYCPKCDNEMIKNGIMTESKDGIVKYRCFKCGMVSTWLFCYPAPFLMHCENCSYVSLDGGDLLCCNKHCRPDTHEKFTM